MELYKNKPREELLKICKNKFSNGRTFDEITNFLNLHKVDSDTQKFIINELEKIEQERRNTFVWKKPLLFSPINMVIGILIITLGVTVLMIGKMKPYFFKTSLIISLIGFIFIGYEFYKVVVNLLFRNKH